MEVLENRERWHGDALGCRESRVVKSISANGRALLSVNRRARNEGAAGHIFVWDRHRLTDAGTPDGRFHPIRFGPSLTDAAPCTFRHKGRKPDFRCGCEPRILHRSEPTFKLALIWVCLCSAEGSTEPSLPNFCNVAKGCNSPLWLAFLSGEFLKNVRRDAYLSPSWLTSRLIGARDMRDWMSDIASAKAPAAFFVSLS
jgi:hypothetical protein